MRIYLPSLSTGRAGVLTSPSEPPEPIEPVLPLSVQESELLWELQHHPDQGRLTLRPHPLLMAMARAKAENIAAMGEVSHIDSEGVGPNLRVLETGYRLPDFYQRTLDANNVESLAGGQPVARMVVSGWSQSPGHWRHAMGPLGSMYNEQIYCGIGYAYNLYAERYGHFWVFVSAPPQPPPPPPPP